MRISAFLLLLASVIALQDVSAKLVKVDLEGIRGGADCNFPNFASPGCTTCTFDSFLNYYTRCSPMYNYKCEWTRGLTENSTCENVSSECPGNLSMFMDQNCTQWIQPTLYECQENYVYATTYGPTVPVTCP